MIARIRASLRARAPARPELRPEQGAGERGALDEGRQALGERQRVAVRGAHDEQADRVAVAPDRDVGEGADVMFDADRVVRVVGSGVPVLDPRTVARALPEIGAPLGRQASGQRDRATVAVERRERDDVAARLEAEEADAAEPRQAEEGQADRLGRRLRRRPGAHRRQRRGQGRPLAVVLVEARLQGALRADVSLDGHAPDDRPGRVANRGDGRLGMGERAVRPPVDELAGPDLAPPDRRPQALDRGGRLLVGREDADVLPDDAVAPEAGSSLERGVDVADRAIEVGDDDRVGGMLDGRHVPRRRQVGESTRRVALRLCRWRSAPSTVSRARDPREWIAPPPAPRGGGGRGSSSSGPSIETTRERWRAVSGGDRSRRY